jgi:hypothetical protein
MNRTNCSSETLGGVMLRKLIVAMIAIGFLMAGTGVAICFERDRQNSKLEERIELLTMWKMMEALNLDKPTAEKIMAIRRKFVDQRKALQVELHEEFRTLRKLLQQEPTKAVDDELEKVLGRIRDKRLKMKGLFDEQYSEVSKVLSVRQRAELVLFLKDFHKEIRSILRSSGPAGAPQDRGLMPRRLPGLRGPEPSHDLDEEAGPPRGR